MQSGAVNRRAALGLMSMGLAFFSAALALERAMDACVAAGSAVLAAVTLLRWLGYLARSFSPGERTPATVVAAGERGVATAVALTGAVGSVAASSSAVMGVTVSPPIGVRTGALYYAVAQAAVVIE